MNTLDTYSQTMMSTYAPPELVLVRGEGVYLWDEAGTRYLDLLAGIACVGLGHSNPQVAAAMADQARTLGIVSNFFATPSQVALAERLTALLGHQARVFFTNSGAESNEAALKITRLTGRSRIVAAQGSFHGRTMGALSVTWTQKYREPFAPFGSEVVWVPYGDAEALAQAVDDTTAAILLEPIQGESGVVVPPDGYLAQARRIADTHGALLWLDEVQTGIGRTGEWFAHTREGIVPDILTLAKALGNGFPIGAVMATGSAAQLFTPGLHGNTYGGNPLSCRVALTVLDLIEPLLSRVSSFGTWLMQQLQGLPGVASVRGRGLMIGICLEDPISPALVKAARNHGIIANSPREDVIRLVPPLIITEDEISQLFDLWPTLLSEASHA